MSEHRMHERFMTVSRTARYVTLGEPAGARQVWFVCHGYGQLASRFLRYFAVLDDGATYIVAPEALSRFYVLPTEGEHGADARVGATWMTREDRLNEINDYIRYLDKLYEEVSELIANDDVEVFVLGFSQGVATAARWIDGGRIRADHIVFWGGSIPRDVDLAGNLARPQMTLVVGDADEHATPQRIEELEQRLSAAQVEYDLVRFEGGHHLNQHVLKRLAGRGRGGSE
jgi:predicted esterase